MKVETYEVTEETLEGVECEDEAKKLIDELGLEGQKTLISPKGDRMPYREMNMEEREVYKLVCPVSTKIQLYSHSPIPTRVLQVAAHANEMFEHVTIWHEEGQPTDPILVGVMPHPERSYEKRYFILARWGDELTSFENLRKRALEIYTSKYKERINEIMGKVKAAMSREIGPGQAFSGRNLPTFYE